MMKRLLILSLCLLLLSGCTENESIRGTISSAEGTANTTSSEGELTETAVESSSNNGDSVEDDLPGESQPAADTEDASESAAISLGHSSENIYESTFIGIGCRLDDSWVFQTDEEILALNQLTLDALGEQYKDLLANSSYLYDMFATQASTASSVYVMLEKLPLQYSSMTVDQYLEVSVQNIAGSLTSIGLQNVTATMATVPFLGKDTRCISVYGENGETPFYETMISIKCRGYMANIYSCSFGADNTADYLDCFYEVETN